MKNRPFEQWGDPWQPKEILKRISSAQDESIDPLLKARIVVRCDVNENNYWAAFRERAGRRGILGFLRVRAHLI